MNLGEVDEVADDSPPTASTTLIETSNDAGQAAENPEINGSASVATE
jgi:hypothetical protein